MIKGLEIWANLPAEVIPILLGNELGKKVSE